MLDGLYRKIQRGVRTKWGMFWLGVLAMLESTIIPVTIELFAAPLMAVTRRPYLIAHVILIGTLAGALVGYAAGALLNEPVIEPALAAMGWLDEYAGIKDDIRENGFWAVFLIGLTPIPFQIGTVGAGVVGYPIHLFVLAVLISRAIRYYAVAVIVDLLGRRAKKFIEQYQSIVLFGGTAILLLAALVYTLYVG